MKEGLSPAQFEKVFKMISDGHYVKTESVKSGKSVLTVNVKSFSDFVGESEYCVTVTMTKKNVMKYSKKFKFSCTCPATQKCIHIALLMASQF